MPAVDPTHWFALAGEDASHFDAVAHLTDRVLESRVDWFDAETRDALREWRGPDAQCRWWSLKSALDDARAARLPTRGHFDGVPKLPEAGMIRAQLLLWQRAHVAGARINVGFLARDVDGESRMEGARQAIADGSWPFRVVLAYPSPEVEAWSIVGFEPESKQEADRLSEVAARLGFSPVAQPHRLTSTVPDSDRDAKRVLDELTGGDEDRRAVCLNRPLDELRTRGAACGLAEFLDAVDDQVVSLYVHAD